MPTAFSDFGAKSEGLFNDRFQAGEHSLTKIGKIGAEAEYELKLTNSIGQDGVDFNFETSSHGHTIKYDGSHTLSHELNFAVKQVKGLQLKFNPSFCHNSGLDLGSASANFENDKLNLNVSAGLSASPNVDFDASTSIKDFDFGVKGSFDSSAGSFNGLQFGVHKATDQYEISYINSNLATPLAGACSIFKMVDNSPFCCVGITGNSDGELAMAAVEGKCCGNQTAYKLNNEGTLSIAKINKLNANMTLNISAALNAKNFSAGGHTFGLGFTFE
jgi:voltage-dependent anion channel protein 3